MDVGEIDAILTSLPVAAGAWAFAAVSARLVPVVLLIPVFGGRWVGLPVQLAVAGALALAVTPVVMSGGAPTTSLAAAAGLGRDVLVGITLGFAGSLVFHAAQAGGAVIDASAGWGANSAEDGDAFRPMSRFLGLLAVVLFFAVGGHHLLIATVVESFRVLPPLGRTVPDPTGAVITLSASLFVLAVQLAAPAIVVTLIVDLLAGVFHRAAPGTNAFFLGLTLKGGLVVGATFVALGVAAVALRGQFADLLRAVEDLINAPA